MNALQYAIRFPNTKVAVITKQFVDCRAIVRQVMQHAQPLQIVHACSVVKNEIVFINGSSFYCISAEKERDLDKLRGHYFDAIQIDPRVLPEVTVLAKFCARVELTGAQLPR